MSRGRSTRWLVFVAALALAGCRASAAPETRGGTPGTTAAPLPSAGCRAGTLPVLVRAARETMVAGEVRRWLVDAAAGPADQPQPVVLVFHGFRHSAAGFRASAGFVEGAARGQYIAVHADGRDDVHLLDGVGRGWDLAAGDTRDTPFVAAMLDALEGERCVDRRRVYATGFSNGGFFANLLGCTLGARLAAVATVSGARPLDGCTPPGPMPMLFFHGAADRVVSPGLSADAAAWWRRVNRCADGAGEASAVGAGCRAARDCAADVVLCMGPQGHTWPADATASITAFFAGHARAD